MKTDEGDSAVDMNVDETIEALLRKYTASTSLGRCNYRTMAVVFSWTFQRPLFLMDGDIFP